MSVVHYRRWLTVLDGVEARWSRVQHPETGRECDGVLFICKMAMWSGAGDNNLRPIRELIDLLRLLVLADPSEFKRLMTTYLLERPGPKELDMHRVFLDAIARRVPVVIKFKVGVNCVGVPNLSPLIPGLFSNESTALAHTEGLFSIERQRLIKSLTQCQWEYLQCHPAQVRLAVSAEEDVYDREDDSYQENLQCFFTEDFFLNLTSFVADMKTATPAPTDGHQDHFLPVAFDGFIMTLQSAWITPRVVQRATELVASGVPVKLERINIDPRCVQCSEEELRSFLGALTKIESKSCVFIGRYYNLRFGPIDSRGEDRTEVLRSIISAVNSLENLHELDVEMVLKVFVSPVNRRLIFADLLVPALGRSKLLSSVTVGMFKLTRDDIAVFRSAVDEWRRTNPGKLLRAKQLRLTGINMDSEIFKAVVDALDDAEEVRIDHYSYMQRGDSSALRSVLRYPSIQRLAIYDGSIESMDLFDPLVADPDLPVKPLLRSLKLEAFTLSDRPSMPRFLRQLRAKSHPLTKSLQTLFLGGRLIENDGRVIDDESCKLLADVLRCNLVLAKASVGLIPVVDKTGRVDDAYIREQFRSLDSTHGRCIEDLDGRQREDNKARNRAFLSVMRSEQPTVPRACRLDNRAFLSVMRSEQPTVPRACRWILLCSGSSSTSAHLTKLDGFPFSAHKTATFTKFMKTKTRKLAKLKMKMTKMAKMKMMKMMKSTTKTMETTKPKITKRTMVRPATAKPKITMWTSKLTKFRTRG